MNIVNKSHIFDTYLFIFNQFNTIKSINSFTTNGQIPGQDLILICNISLECLEKLSEVSELIEKKQNDLSLNLLTINHLDKLAMLHNNLFSEICSFNQIANDATNIAKEIVTLKLNTETINYLNFNLINKYKLIIFIILDVIKKINVYVELLKSKLN